MRVTVLGGTRFIGRAIVEDLVAAGHEVTVVHRGETEPAGYAAVEHVHLPRASWTTQPGLLERAEPEVVVDCLAMARDDVLAAAAVIPASSRVVVLSSHDVYRAFASVNAGGDTDAVPVDETSPLRDDRYPYRGQGSELDDYSKRDVEDEYLRRSATVLRIPATYGEHDPRCREEFILRRVRARRSEIPVGGGGFLWTRGWVRDVARGVRFAAESSDVAGLVLNLGEERSWSMRLWAQHIIEAAESDAQLVEVADDALPEDLLLTSGRASQHMLVDTSRARRLIAYADSDPMTALRSSVGWHLRHPPEDDAGDFSADDAALLDRLAPRRVG